MDYVIIGSGIAGMTAAKTIRKYDPNGSITVYTYEFHPVGCYTRKDLTRRLTTELVEPDEMLIDNATSLAELNIRVDYKEVVRVAPHLRQVLHPHYARTTYDRLLIASGAVPRLVDAPGLHYIGVHQLWNYEDASLIEAWMPELQQRGAVVIGGGILGIDAAYALSRRGVTTTLVAREKRLGVPRLSEDDAHEVEERLRHAGVEVILGDTLEAYLSEDERLLDGVRLSSGRILSARMALCAVGVHPCTDFLKESRLEIDEQTGALWATSTMQTNFPEVYAAGSCAIVDGYIASNWSQSAEQGRIAGLNMVGQQTTYQPTQADPVVPLILESLMQPS
jgi:nitrite reductase (NADH) large subunit